MWKVYILLCDNKTYYVGITFDIEKRLQEHQSGLSKFTKQFSTIKLIYTEEFNSKYLAAKREKQLKGWSRIKKEKLIRGEL